MEETNTQNQNTQPQTAGGGMSIAPDAVPQTGGKKCNKCLFLMLVGIIFLVAFLVMYIFNMYQMKMYETEKMLSEQETMAEDMPAKPDTENEAGRDELLNELTNEVDTEMDKIESEIESMETEMNELENLELN